MKKLKMKNLKMVNNKMITSSCRIIMEAETEEGKFCLVTTQSNGWNLIGETGWLSGNVEELSESLKDLNTQDIEDLIS